MTRAGRDRQAHWFVRRGPPSPVGHRAAANRLRTARLAIFALLVHSWVPLAFPLPDAAAVQHPDAADHAAVHGAGAHDVVLPPAPSKTPLGGHHAPGSSAADVECPVCIVGQLAKALPDAAAPALPIVAAVRDRGFRPGRQRVPYRRPIRTARPRAPPSPADPS